MVGSVPAANPAAPCSARRCGATDNPHGRAAQGAAQAGSAAPRPVPHVGLHRWRATSQPGADAEDPRRRVRAARRPNLADTGSSGNAPRFTVTEVKNYTTDRERQLPAGHGHVHGALLPDRTPGAAAGSRLNYLGSPTGCRPRPRQLAPGARSAATSRARPLGGPAAPRCTATACSAARARSNAGQRPGDGATSTTSRSARPTGAAWRRGHRRTRSRSWRTSRSSPTLADRMQQGILNFLYLGRLHAPSAGLRVERRVPGRRRPVAARHVATLFYDGNSQGGDPRAARSPPSRQDWTRAVLGVPAMNYSLLLTALVDLDTYRAIFDPAYPEAARARCSSR